MGCGSSRAVIVPSDTNVKNSTRSLKENSKKTISANKSLVSQNRDKNNNVNRPDGNATEVDENLGQRREISATSTRTTDSGISDLPQDEDIITENSNPNQLTHVGGMDRPETPDLVLQGVACPRKQSGKERRRLELENKNSESSVPKLPLLTNNSLLERPKTRGGLAFDITFCPETGNMKKAQLPKLERRKNKNKLTKEELEEKMRKAAGRRQEHNKKIQEKSHAFVLQYENVVRRRQERENNDVSEENSNNTRQFTETMSIFNNTDIEKEQE